MHIRTLSEHVKVCASLFPVANSNSIIKGLAVDTFGYERAAVVFAGAPGSSSSPSFKIQESVDTTDGHFADITIRSGLSYPIFTGTASVGPATVNNSGLVVAELLVRRHKRYLRVNSVASGGTAGAQVGFILLYNSNDSPVAQDAHTTIAAASDGLVLPTGTITVVSTANFPAAGTLRVVTENGPQQVAYTGITGTTFTTCTLGTGTLATGQPVDMWPVFDF